VDNPKRYIKQRWGRRGEDVVRYARALAFKLNFLDRG
jgi:hypothetical protein